MSIQQQISANTVVEVAYAGNKANHLLDQREEDPAVSTIVNGQPFYPSGSPRINPFWGGIRLTEAEANSDYNSATVTLRRQFSHGFEGQVFYSFSKAMDDASESNNGESVQSPASTLDPNNIARDWGLSNFNSTHAVVGTFSYALPFRVDSKFLGAIVNGWTFDSITTLTSGQPMTMRLAAAVSRDMSSVLSERPNLNAGFSTSPTSGVSAGCPGTGTQVIHAGTVLGNPTHWYDPCAFSLPIMGTYGNLGRNTVIGPGVEEEDMAIEKNFKLYERITATFRAEMFNVLNHANFGLPNTTPVASTGLPNPSAGSITYTTTSQRETQFALRISF